MYQYLDSFYFLKAMLGEHGKEDKRVGAGVALLDFNAVCVVALTSREVEVRFNVASSLGHS